MSGLSRRALLAAAAAAPAFMVSARAQSDAARQWRGALIINALGGLGNPNAEDEDESGRTLLDARTLSDARASGLTAVNWTLGHVFGAGEPYEMTVAEISQMDRMIRDQSRHLLKVLTASDIERARRDRKIGVIYGFQNTEMLGDKLDRIDVFTDLGVRVFQLTYNLRNTVGDGSMVAENHGLTAFGREVVARLNANRVMVDLSHSGENTCLEAARISAQPISINHTGCRALTDLPRNKTDAELRLVAERGGFIGIYFMPFLDMSGHARAEHVVAHIEHAVEVCGEDAVGIGTDGSVTQIDDLDAYAAALTEENARRRAAGISAPGERADTYPFVVDLRGANQFYDLAERLRARPFAQSD